MKTFLLDLWHDLREKRLWPVAAALAIGVVAVPVLLLKPAESPSAPATPGPSKADLARQRAQAGLAVAAAADETGKGSPLDVFSSKNPFRPDPSVIDKSSSSSSSSATATAAAPSTSSSGAPQGSGSAPSPAGGGGGVVGGGAAARQPSSRRAGGTPARVRVTRYTYVVDVSFGRNGHERRRRGLGRLDMLPSQESPLLISLGVDAGAESAVFLVDSSLDTTGEGRCKPSHSDCAVLYLGAGSEQAFTDGRGNSYTLRVDEIRRVKVSAARAHQVRRAHRLRRAHAASAQASRPRRRFVTPLITDLVTVATPSGGRSSAAAAGR